MRVEWRSNIWMIVELTIVGLIVALVTMVIAQLVSIHSQPSGYDLTDIYRGQVNYLRSDADEYIDYTDTPEKWQEDLNLILRKLRENPNVEIVGIGSNCLPYNYNFNGWNVTYFAPDSAYIYAGNMRYVDADAVKAIRLRGPKGETTEQLAAVIERGEWIVGTNNPDSGNCDPYNLVKQTVVINGDTTKLANVGAVSYGIARDDYEGVIRGCILRPFTQDNRFPREVIVRVKPGMGHKFKESINLKELSQRNVFFNNFTSIDDMRDAAQRNIDTFERNIMVCAVFLLVAVFLGFLGSFWFRTQQRVPEIALRKVVGASQWQIFSRLVSEGMIMLVIAAIFFSPIYFYVSHEALFEIGLGNSMISAMPIYIAYVVALIILALTIIAGIWFPARRAMKVEPAIALKDQ